MGSRKSCDVVVVGGRCAGGSLAAELALQGRSVVLLDRSEFPSDAFSTHLIHADGAAYLDRVGILSELVEAGCPMMRRLKACFDGVELDEHYAADAPFGGAVSASRKLLDAALLDRCRTVGVDVRTRANVVDVVWDNHRAAGVVARTGDDEYEIRADLVVGADGRNSVIANRVGSRRYHVSRGERFIYWADFAGVDPGTDPAMWNIRRGPHLWLAFFSDAGRLTIAISPPMSGFAAFSEDIPANFDRLVASCPELAGVVGEGERVGRPIGTASLDAYFREPSGPGWVLVGDAGVFKDPVLGQGITDAFRHAVALADELDNVNFGFRSGLDAATARFGAWRDEDVWDMYWLAVDAAAGRRLNALESGIFAAIASRPTLSYRFAVELPSHWRPSSSVLTLPTILRGLGIAALRDRAPLSELVSGASERIGNMMARSYQRRRPTYQPADATPG